MRGDLYTYTYTHLCWHRKRYRENVAAMAPPKLMSFPPTPLAEAKSIFQHIPPFRRRRTFRFDPSSGAVSIIGVVIYAEGRAVAGRYFVVGWRIESVCEWKTRRRGMMERRTQVARASNKNNLAMRVLCSVCTYIYLFIYHILYIIPMRCGCRSSFTAHTVLAVWWQFFASTINVATQTDSHTRLGAPSWGRSCMRIDGGHRIPVGHY